MGFSAFDSPSTATFLLSVSLPLSRRLKRPLSLLRPPLQSSLFRRLAHGPEAASKELSPTNRRVARTDFLPSAPFPSTHLPPHIPSPATSYSYPPSTPAASLVVTLPTRAPVYLSNHMVRYGGTGGQAGFNDGVISSKIYPGCVRAAWLIGFMTGARGIRCVGACERDF